ncbi:hypothetical protein [Sphingobacterium sp. LRF_L2]|uniref:hypothetical protein n=1 Tax=Sphingobacterium sp. LRF_L2 TaxID=3369421 RepID=UPI003F622442
MITNNRFNHKLASYSFLACVTLSFFLISCQQETSNAQSNSSADTLLNKKSAVLDTTSIAQNVDLATAEIDSPAPITPKLFKPIQCDLDGDGISETVSLLLDPHTGKSGLQIKFGGTEKIDSLGFGKDVLDRGFDDLEWVGIFEKAPKNEVYFDNVNEEGEIIGEDEVDDADKIRLENDGIFIHAAESCGGGVIYLHKEQYHWIQQE